MGVTVWTPELVYWSPKLCEYVTDQLLRIIFQWNFVCTLVQRCEFQIWHCFLKILSPNVQIWAFWVKKYQLSNLFSKIFHALYFDCADFKSDIGIWKFWAQIPKYGHFGSKSINFLILAKFCLYPISKVLISNLTLVIEKFEPKCPNMDLLDQKV